MSLDRAFVILGILFAAAQVATGVIQIRQGRQSRGDANPAPVQRVDNRLPVTSNREPDARGGTYAISSAEMWARLGLGFLLLGSSILYTFSYSGAFSTENWVTWLFATSAIVPGVVELAIRKLLSVFVLASLGAMGAVAGHAIDDNYSVAFAAATFLAAITLPQLRRAAISAGVLLLALSLGYFLPLMFPYYIVAVVAIGVFLAIYIGVKAYESWHPRGKRRGGPAAAASVPGTRA